MQLGPMTRRSKPPVCDESTTTPPEPAPYQPLTRIGLLGIDLDMIVAIFPHQRDFYGIMDSVGTIYFRSGQSMQVKKDLYVEVLRRLFPELIEEEKETDDVEG
jgi:hypothetical protein